MTRVVSGRWVLTGRPNATWAEPGRAFPLSPGGGRGAGPPTSIDGEAGGVARRRRAQARSAAAGRGEGGEWSPRAIPGGAIVLEGDTVVAVGRREDLEPRYGRAERLDAILLPALVNAHLHLEVSHLAGRVPGGQGLPRWIGSFVAMRAATPSEEEAPAMGRAVEALRAAGVAAVGDVSNTLASVAPLATGGIQGSVYHEIFGMTPERVAAALDAARAAREKVAAPKGLRIAPSPHAVYSTHPATIASLLAGGPGSIHLAEDPAERAFVATGEGPFAAFLARMGQGPDPRPRARSAVALVAPHLGPHHLAVHCVDVDAEDLAALAASGATVVLCPRSNRHIGGRLPDLCALLAAGVPLAVGTDSLASCASLAPLADLALLAAEFPEVPAAQLMALAWNGAAVGAASVGALVPGTAPGILCAPLTPTLSPRAQSDHGARGAGGEGVPSATARTPSAPAAAAGARSPLGADEPGSSPLGAGEPGSSPLGAGEPGSSPLDAFDPYDFLLRAHGAEARPFHWIARNRAEA